MVVSHQRITFEAGDSIQLDLWITKDGELLDLTALDIEFLLGPNTLSCGSGTTATLWKRSTQGSTEIEKVSTGLARIKLLTADTTSLCGPYVWTARVIDGVESNTAARGTAKVSATLGDPP